MALKDDLERLKNMKSERLVPVDSKPTYAELEAEVARLTAILRTIYAGGTFPDDLEDWQDLQQHTRAAGIAYGQNQNARKVAEAMGWERPIGPPSKLGAPV